MSRITRHALKWADYCNCEECSSLREEEENSHFFREVGWEDEGGEG